MRQNNRQTVHFFELSGLPHIRAVRGVNVTHAFRRHVHESFCIGAVTEGSRVMSYGDTSIVIPKNALFVINQGEAHSFKSADPAHSYMILSVPPAYMQAFNARIAGKTQPVPHFKNTPIHDMELYLKICSIFEKKDKAGSNLHQESALFSLLSLLILRHTVEPPGVSQKGLHGRTVRRVCEFIGTHYAESLSLKQLSGEAGLSPFYFQRLFLEKTGISPHDYLIQIRIGKARQMLIKGYSIAHVALDTGFSDQSHFTRTFQRLMGTTPGEYITVA